ncbi:MAG: calcium/sodium antiporter [Epulopiscium sp.]|nr:calcium/sodium antiporter [Candidatus Epulonipiscium sp.]
MLEQMMPFILFTAGLIMIIKGSDWFVDSAVWIARASKIPDIIIGATLVSLCTTLPEAMVSTNSALRGNTDMAFGNALGSIIFNTGFILAITILFSTPRLRERKKFQKTGRFLLLLLIFLLVIGILFQEISRFTGIFLLIILLLYMFYNVQTSRQKPDLNMPIPVHTDKGTVIKNIVAFIVGVILTIGGANLLVVYGEEIARILGVPDLVIGLLLTSVGTSLPELVTAIVSMKKGNQDLSIGNVLGANILNIILVIGLSATILPIHIGKSWIVFHLPFAIFIIGLVLLFIRINKEKLQRKNGLFLLASYLMYFILTFTIFK